MSRKILFPKSKNLGKRDWGREDLLVHIPKTLTLKKLFIKKEEWVVCNFIERKMSVDI